MIIVNLSQSMSQFGVMNTATPYKQDGSRRVITL
nr:MAG TPA: hypothetical protein [Caudoviricetes sp.]